MFYYTMTTDLRDLLTKAGVGSLSAVLLVTFAVTASGAGLAVTPLMDGDGGEPASVDSQSQYKGYVQVQHQRDVDNDGEYETVDSYKSHNMVMNQGLSFFECVASGVGCPSASNAGTATGADTATYISLSDKDDINGEADDAFDSSADQNLETLPGEITSGGLSRAEGTVANESIGHYSVSNTFTASSDFTGSAIEWTGLHWSPNIADDDIVAGNHFPGVTMLADDKLTIDWVEVSFNR